MDAGDERAPKVGRPRDEARREAILAAALRVFAARGYDGTTMKAAAAAAGLGSAAALQHYFPHKDDLFSATILRFAAVEAMVHDDDLDEPPEAFLPEYLRRYLAQFTQPDRLLALRIMSNETLRLLELGLDLSGARITEVFPELERYLARQVELGRLRAAPEHLARVLLGAVNLHVQNRYSPFLVAVSDDELIAAVTDIVLHGAAS